MPRLNLEKNKKMFLKISGGLWVVKIFVVSTCSGTNYPFHFRCAMIYLCFKMVSLLQSKYKNDTTKFSLKVQMKVASAYGVVGRGHR